MRPSIVVSVAVFSLAGAYSSGSAACVVLRSPTKLLSWVAVFAATIEQLCL